jgi:predicted RND superfamily exporter protein
MANPEPITLEGLPENIRNQFVNEAGDRFLLTIYAKSEIWDYENLRRFNDQLELVDPNITGMPPVMERLFNLVAQDGVRATLLTVVIVFLLLWIDFRSLRFALLGLIPLVAGGLWMTGILKSTGMMLTFFNVLGIPMIVGIAIDDGVHLLHRYKFEGLGKTPLVLKSTGKAILLTSLTTMVGFGSLLLATMRGFISLGSLLVFGVGACFLTTVLFLPSIIGLWKRKRENSAA